MAFSEASPEPDPAELTTDVYVPFSYTPADYQAEWELRQRVRSDPEMRVIPYAQALQEAMREEIITATLSWIGPEGNLLDRTPESCHQIVVEHPVLTNSELAQIAALNG